MNSITPTDVYQIVNAMAKSLYGGDTTLQAVDTTSFVSVGETMLRTGYENTLAALTLQIGDTIFASRPYTGKFRLVARTENEWATIRRKISYFYDGFEASQDWNTQLDSDQLVDGASIDQYKIRKRYPLEVWFCGLKTLQKHWTRFRYQLRIAFKNEEEFARFYEGLAVEINNEIEMMREVENQATVLNYIGALYQSGNAAMKVNLTAAFNAAKGTSYTSQQLRTTYFSDFLAFFVATVKKNANMLEHNTNIYHLTPDKEDDAGNKLVLLRHTPKAYQQLMLYRPFYIDAEAEVLPEIFNDQYLKITNYEGVDYWQNPNDPTAVNVKPNYLDITTGQSKDATAAVSIPYVLGIQYDYDALGIAYMIDDQIATPVNAAANYYNTFLHFAKNYKNDFTENGILYYMEDPATEPDDPESNASLTEAASAGTAKARKV